MRRDCPDLRPVVVMSTTMSIESASLTEASRFGKINLRCKGMGQFGEVDFLIHFSEVQPSLSRTGGRLCVELEPAHC